MIRIKKARLDCKRWKWLVLMFVNLFDTLVNLCSLGYLTADNYARVLFSEWMDEDED